MVVTLIMVAIIVTALTLFKFGFVISVTPFKQGFCMVFLLPTPLLSQECDSTMETGIQVASSRISPDTGVE